MQKLEPDSIDLIVTDPPYGYSFMGKDWDKAVVSVDIWKECLRVLKPGAFAFIMSSPRQDVLCKMILNLIDAGFETNFTSLYHAYASGFPKAMNIGKKTGNNELQGTYGGFQPKPAVEVILTVMKPLNAKSYVDQALTNGKGCVNFEDCRIPYQSESDVEQLKQDTARFKKGQPLTGFDPKKGWNNHHMIHKEFDITKGRFPANILCGSAIDWNIAELLQLQEAVKNT